jgi:hypothetical protein
MHLTLSMACCHLKCSKQQMFRQTKGGAKRKKSVAKVSRLQEADIPERDVWIVRAREPANRLSSTAMPIPIGPSAP